MEEAGQAVYSLISREVEVRDRRFAVFSGPGNNGGDGFVVARKLHEAGGRVRALVLGGTRSYSGPARKNLERLMRSGVDVRSDPGTADVVGSLAWCHVVVDGLLGTGIGGSLHGRFREVVEEVNRAGKPVISIDIPSGVDGDTGEVHGIAIRASTTVTFGLPKRGNILGPGSSLGGRLVLSHISFPSALIDDPDIKVGMNEPSAFPGRTDSSEDGKRGKVVFILSGADSSHSPALASRTFASLRGRPYSMVASSLLADAVGKTHGSPCPEEPSELGVQAERGEYPGLLSFVGPASLVVFGDGADGAKAGYRIMRTLMGNVTAPLILDGGMLDAQRDKLDDLRHRVGPTVLVLKPADMARLTGMPLSDWTRNGLSLLSTWVHEYGVLAVLTGATPFIAMPDCRVLINAGRSPQCEVPGGEQILIGIIASLYDLGLTLEDAVCSGVFLFSVVTDRATPQRQMLEAEDLLREVPASAQAFMLDYEGVKARHLRPVDVI